MTTRLALIALVPITIACAAETTDLDSELICADVEELVTTCGFAYEQAACLADASAAEEVLDLTCEELGAALTSADNEIGFASTTAIGDINRVGDTALFCVAGTHRCPNYIDDRVTIGGAAGTRSFRISATRIDELDATNFAMNRVPVPVGIDWSDVVTVNGSNTGSDTYTVEVCAGQCTPVQLGVVETRSYLWGLINIGTEEFPAVVGTVTLLD